MPSDFLPQETDAATPSHQDMLEILEKLRRLDAEATAREMAVEADQDLS